MKTLDKVLHVEDEADILEVTRIALEAVGGLTVQSCSSGMEALKKAPEFMPDLILLDVMMPEMDGPKTLVKLRELSETKDVPVVFMTAKILQTEIEKYKDLGVIDIITKPFDPMALADQLKTIWNNLHG